MKRHKEDQGPKNYVNPEWVESMAITADYNFAMAEFVGEANGLTDQALEALTPRLEAAHRDLAERRQAGELAFFDLPYQEDTLTEVKRLARSLKEWCWDLVVLGIGGSALGARALHQALCHPSHNLFPPARRHYHSRLIVADNIEPDWFYGILDGLDLRRSVVNVISKSGSTAETLAQFLFLYSLLKGRLGAEKVRERFVLTTDPAKGNLRRLIAEEGFPALTVPPEVGGRFSVFTAVGLFPAVMMGIDAGELMAGARYMDVRLRNAPVAENLAYRLAAVYYLFATAKGRPIQVLMPYASTLGGVAEWFCQLWAESLGKRVNLKGEVVEVGPTPVRAVGATDQHSQVQLYMEGPADKIITFIEVEKFKHVIEIPGAFPHIEGLGYLGGHSLNELLAAEKKATAYNLMRAGRPNLTIRLPEINAFTIGQLLYLYEVMTLAAGALFEINPLDQPGVEGGKQTAYGLMGRPGYEDRRRELETAPALLDRYLLS